MSIISFPFKLKKHKENFCNDAFIEQYLFYSWQTLLDKNFTFFYRNMQNIELAAYLSNTKMSKLVQLIFISVFIEDCSYTKADYLLNQYVKTYGYNEIHQWLVISNYLVRTKKCTDNSIIKSAKLYNIFDKADKNLVMNKAIANKIIAVVGNGPSEVGKNKGTEIDAHDIVIRFNDFSTEKQYIKDYGEKIDIWSFGPALDPNLIDKIDITRLKILLIPVPFKRRCFSLQYIEKLLEVYEKGVIIAPTNVEVLDHACNTINTTFPTGGVCYAIICAFNS